MPNWCSNSMGLHGPSDQVRNIVNAVRPKGDPEERLGLTNFMPQPTDENGELIEGVSWQYENWGTKWGDCDTDIVYEDYDDNGTGSASLVYNTAWGPMTGLTKEISRLHPGVTIDVEYEEPGMNFFGVEQFVAGEAVLERHHEYDFETGKIVLPDGWEASFDTDWEDEDQDPMGTLNDAIHAAMEHMWVTKSLGAPEDSNPISS